MPRCRFLLAACFAVQLMLGGCATVVFNPAANVPLEADTPRPMDPPRDTYGSDAIALSFSGGGLRAAAFSFGVLEALARMKTADGDLLDDVAFIGSVSGGSLTAAYFGLHGREGLTRFRDDVLAQDFEARLRLTAFAPWNLARILGGGLNENFGDILDGQVFHGARFADMRAHPRPEIRIHATDLYNRVAFPFTPQLFSLICSDLSRYRVADAVAASMAIPLVFAPVVLRPYPESCTEPLPASLARIRFDPDAPMLEKAAEAAIRSYRESPGARYIKLVDGGVSDNLGVSTLILSRVLRGAAHSPLTDADAVRIRRLLFIVVDASRPPSGDWAQHEQGPSGVALAVAAGDAAVDSAARLAADTFGHTLREWERAVIAFRCSLSREHAEQLGAGVDWKCGDVRVALAFISVDRLDDTRLRAALDSMPTRLTLPSGQIDLAVEGGREAALASPRLHRYLRERGRS